jgi:hypothetical protein
MKIISLFVLLILATATSFAVGTHRDLIREEVLVSTVLLNHSVAVQNALNQAGIRGEIKIEKGEYAEGGTPMSQAEYYIFSVMECSRESDCQPKGSLTIAKLRDRLGTRSEVNFKPL